MTQTKLEWREVGRAVGKLIEITLSNWWRGLWESGWVTVQGVTWQQLKPDTGDDRILENSEKRLGTDQIYGACWACL